MTSTLTRHSVSITFSLSIFVAILLFVLGLNTSWIPFPSLVLFIAAIVYSAVLMLVAGDPDRSTGSERSLICLACEVLVWLCAPTAIMVQRYGMANADLATGILVALFLLAVCVIAMFVARRTLRPLSEVVLVPISALSALLYLGGSEIGHNFLQPVVPGGVLDTNLLLRALIAGTVIVWLFAGIFTGLRERMPRINSMQRHAGTLHGALGGVLKLYVMAAWEILIGTVAALGRSFRAIFNKRSSLLSALLSSSILLWILMYDMADAMGTRATEYFSTHAYDGMGVVSLLLVACAIFISSLIDEIVADFDGDSVDIVERAQRFVPLFSATSVAIFLCSLIGHILYPALRYVSPETLASIPQIHGFAFALTPSVLLVLPALLMAYCIWWLFSLGEKKAA